MATKFNFEFFSFVQVATKFDFDFFYLSFLFIFFSLTVREKYSKLILLSIRTKLNNSKLTSFVVHKISVLQMTTPLGTSENSAPCDFRRKEVTIYTAFRLTLIPQFFSTIRYQFRIPKYSCYNLFLNFSDTRHTRTRTRI